MSNPQVSIETITPEQAAQMLRTNSGNRKINIDRVLRYAMEMREGKWRLTGESLIIDSNGALANGQHRLAACVEANVPFITSVMRGVDPGVFLVVDSGMPRTAAQALAHQGISHATNVAAAARLVAAYRNGAVGNPRLMARTSTHQSILAETLEHYARYSKLGPDALRAYRNGFNTTAFIAFGMLLGELIGDREADEWMHRAATGADLETGDPRLALRNWQRFTRRRQAPYELSAWIRAWNAFAVGETRSQIRPWTPGTPFPKLVAPQVAEEGAA